MARTYTVDITNGEGTKLIEEGIYTISSTIGGYNNESLTPKSATITGTTGTFDFTIAATGTLTLHVTETGEATGTAVVGAKFYRTDDLGAVYGEVITSDQDGNAVFNNVPFSSTLPPNVYYKQTDSDGSHNFSTDVDFTTLSSSTKTVEIINPIAASQNFKITDANYPNLSLLSGTIDVSK